MGGQWIYEPHKCDLPSYLERRKYRRGSIWECDCGLQYFLDNNLDMFPDACGKTICARQGGHEGPCNF